MSDSWVRCGRCHEVFEAAEACPSCGAPYQPRAPQPVESADSYVERYAGSEFVPPGPPPAPLAAPRRRNPTPFIVGGTALVVVALVLAAVSGAWSGPGIATLPPLVIVGTPKPTTMHSTLPDTVVATLAHLSDSDFSATLSIRSRISVDARVQGTATTLTSTFDGELSGANQIGRFTQGGASTEVCIFEGSAWIRTHPTARWTAAENMAPYMVLQPLFGLTEEGMLEFVGPDTRDGVAVNHFRATRHWAPDVGRMALADTTSFGIRPDTFAFDIWAAQDGTPVYAAFSATTTASDGTKLIDIGVTYRFSAVGVPHVIPDPKATPTPGPSPSPSASPSATTP
jgi:hypothetical protein